ncbi:MAG: urate hydroxylase PuuD [Candidatus Omnitrophica bacterium]|nr:urate hydroxylase PuuD [Candidatus Omnitrophota bacterium]
MSEALTLDLHTVSLFLLRWIHFLAGIVWIGALYFFNLVNGPFAKTMDAETKKKVVPQLMPRALWWFRWGAMVTILSGYAYILWKIFIATDAGLYGTGGLFNSTWGKWITMGAGLGTIMWFNVWFIIWPIQKKLITGTKTGQPPAQAEALTKRAFFTSRINTYLSVPLLFSMGAASHYPVFNTPTVLAALLGGFGIAWFFIEKVSGKAGANFS